MEKFKEMVKKELKTFEEQGLTSSNLNTVSTLVDILKDLGEIDEEKKEKKERGEEQMPYYREGYGREGYGARGYSGEYGARGYSGEYGARGNYREGYGARGNYREGYGMPSMFENYGRQGGGSYQHHGCEHFFEKMDRMLDCLEEYVYSKGRYRDGGHGGKMVEDIEKTMYAVCALVESLMDSADTPEEKEAIRKHIDKIKAI